MKILKTVAELKHYRLNLGKKSLGFVPTMGSLHEGHLSLVRKSKVDNEVTLVSIFVNPSQFAPHEDFKNYPRNEEKDFDLLKREKVEAVFLPNKATLYPAGFDTWVNIPSISYLYEGVSRPRFFGGVLTVVLKLFHLVKPSKAYFGKKDYQQFFLVKKMGRELHLEINIVGCALIREPSGLAMSSRNFYFNEEEKKLASRIHLNLWKIKKMALKYGIKQVEKLKQKYLDEMALISEMKVDYFEIVDKLTLSPQKETNQRSILLTAVFLGKVRLVDNLELFE